MPPAADPPVDAVPPVVGVVVAGGAVVVVVVEVASGVVQAGLVMTSVSRVTAPVRASTRPATCTPDVSVTEARAMTVPTKVLVVPRVAELVTCQKTLQACAVPTSATVLLEWVVSVEPTWKMNTAVGSPVAVQRDRADRPSDNDALQTPAGSVAPPVWPRRLSTGLGPPRPDRRR